MPFFMDIHLGDKVLDPEIVREAHLMDKAIEHRYGVKHIHYYVNGEEGLGFCLMSGPDKETCARVHKESHGNVASNIIEVQQSTYETVMGKVKADNFDMIQTNEGAPDTGYRHILVTELVGLTGVNGKSPEKILQVIGKNGGRLVDSTRNALIGVFTDCNEAIYCAGALVSLVSDYKLKGLDLKIGLFTGTPVTRSSKKIFDKAIERATQLARIAPMGHILVASRTASHCNGNVEALFDSKYFILINAKQERFIDQLFTNLNHQVESGSISVENLCLQMGVSRAQLYRKICTLSGKSPKEFIKELRLLKAVQMINSGEFNISEIAYSVGYSQPAIFSKHFKQHFGKSPSRARKLAGQLGN